MTFTERYGDHNTPHREKYGKCVEELGLDTLKQIIPWSKEELAEAYEKDESFNSISIREWDRLAGFSENPNTGYISKFFTPLQGYLEKAGVTYYSLSELVCVLKEAARQIVEEGRKEAETV